MKRISNIISWLIVSPILLPLTILRFCFKLFSSVCESWDETIKGVSDEIKRDTISEKELEKEEKAFERLMNEERV